MTGTIVNAVSIVAGAGIGVLLKKGIPDNIKNTILQGLSLAVMVIGLQMALQSKNILSVVLSLVLGGLTGELLKIEDRLASFGSRMETLFSNSGGSFTKAFVTASLVYCVGAMAIVGSIQDGISGNPDTLFIKALLDGTASIVFASTLGIGVAFSALPVLVYQGSITLLAGYLQEILTQPVVTELTATGGILIVGIGIRILGISDIRVGNLLPAVGFALMFAVFLPL